MTGSLNPIYINTTIQVLEKRCFILLSEVYADIKSKKTISINWVEEDISKELTNCLQSNKKRIAWKIRVEPEHRLYKEDNLSANKSPRIDFCFSTCDNITSNVPPISLTNVPGVSLLNVPPVSHTNVPEK